MSDPQQEIIVTVDTERVLDVAARLRHAGMEVTQALPITGMLTGSAPSSRIAEIRRLDGVTAVEASRSIVLAPPDSPLQ